MTLPSSRRLNNDGFTLIEFVVVLAIVALLTACAQLILNTPLRIARMRHAINLLTATDGTLRHECRKKSRQGTIEFDCKARTMTIRSDGWNGSKSFPLYGLARIRTSLGEHSNWKTTIDQWGRSESYAIELDVSNKNKWILCAGATGQMMEEQSESDIEAILDQLTPSNLAY
jgi:prepilin-type N-terminal cleavage/methylation domain-containing protein